MHEKLMRRSFYFVVDENPLLTQEEYCKFTHNPLPGSHLFPSLKEFTAREIIKKNIPSTKTLPTVLQGTCR